MTRHVDAMTKNIKHMRMARCEIDYFSSIRPSTADRILEQLLEMGCFRMQPQAAAVFAVEMENLQKQLVAPWRNSEEAVKGMPVEE